MTYRGVVLDLDGTVYRHREPVPGAVAAVAALRERDVRVVFFSNNPTAAPGAYVARLGEMGLSVAAEEVRSSASVTADYLAANHAGDDVYVVGSTGLKEVLRRRDLTLTDDPAEPDAVLASWTREFDYDAMMAAMRALDGEVPFLGTDPDVTVPIADGRSVPGSGAILAALASVAGREPRILGKPSAEAARAARDALGVPAEDCLVVGDRPDTDLALGERVGMDTALVLTGVTDRADLEDAAVTPDHVLDSLAALPTLLD